MNSFEICSKLFCILVIRKQHYINKHNKFKTKNHLAIPGKIDQNSEKKTTKNQQILKLGTKFTNIFLNFWLSEANIHATVRPQTIWFINMY
jgi:hypothetical protein